MRSLDPALLLRADTNNGQSVRGARRPTALLSVLISVLILLTLPLAESQPATVSTENLEQLIRQIETSYHGVRTLRADFTETYTWGARKRTESGVVYFARGGLMRWDYSEPSKKLFLSDGKEVDLYVPEEKQLTRSRLRSSEDIRVPFLLMLARPNLHRLFSRIGLASDQPRDPADFVLRGFPKAGHEDDFQEVLMEFDRQFNVRRIVIVSNDRTTMEFAFDRIERNVPVGPALFHFTPPAGTEVIEQP